MANEAVRKSGGDIVALSRIPPQALEAEQAILASVLMENHAINTCLEFIGPEDFYKEAHRIIFQAMIDLNARNEPTDLVTLEAYLRTQQWLDQVGGASYMAQLVDNTPTAANVASYAKFVREKALVRNLIFAATDIVTNCHQPYDEVGQLMDSAESLIFAVSDKRNKKSFSPVKELLKDSFKMIEKLYENKSHLTGLTTGFKDLDVMTSGLQPGELFIIAGRPSMGKTAFVLNMLASASKIANARVAVFSLEMSKESLVMRMLTAEARIDASRLRTGSLEESDWPRLTKAADTLSHYNVYIDDSPAQSAMEIRAKVRRLAKEHGLDLVVVDYLQLMRGSANVNSREQEISEISRSLKAIAKELHVPVVALSQLNRSLESRTNKRPMMSDLRESGAIEQDADVIAFIYRDEVYDPNSPDKGVAEIIIGKQRNGPTGTVRLAFLNSITRFEDLVYDSQYAGYQPPDE